MNEHIKAVLKSYYTVGVKHSDVLNIMYNDIDAYHRALIELLADIEERQLNVCTRTARQLRAKNTNVLLDRYLNSRPFVKYDFLSHKTGRFVVFKDYFNVLNMPKRVRSIVKPNNDFFLCYDYNAADFRVFMSLSGLVQPKIDLYEYHRQLLYPKKTRDEIKIGMNAWLYSYRKNELDDLYDKVSLLEKYWDGQTVTNHFGRKMETDKQNKAMNYLISSTMADSFFRQSIKVFNLLKGLKSYIAFMIHDSVWIDASIEDHCILNNIRNVFGDTVLGKFIVNVEKGEDFEKVV